MTTIQYIRTGCFLAAAAAVMIWSCNPGSSAKMPVAAAANAPELLRADTNAIPKDKYGDMVRYGRALMLNTAYYIGPDGVNGRYLGNKMNCNNCHQEAGTKAFSFNLMLSHQEYPQYRAREGKVLTLAERINNCVTRPHNGKPLPLDSKEMVAFLAYLRWINSFVPKDRPHQGSHNLAVKLSDTAADPEKGKVLYQEYCARCHGKEGEGQLAGVTYTYPPLWGPNSYQPGSSMHRVIKQAQWLKANMPYDKATWNKPFLTDEEALDIAAFVNNDSIHARPDVKNYDYPHVAEKAIDYDKGPFADTFSAQQHKYGPFRPVISYWEQKGMKASY